MNLREELQDRADKLDAELLALSGRMKAIERESDDVHTCLNALDLAEMDEQDAALNLAPDAQAPVDEPEIPEGFTRWESGYCPFPIGTNVEVLTRKCGVWNVDIKPEAPLLWEHEAHDLDVIAYRVIQAPALADPLSAEPSPGDDRVETQAWNAAYVAEVLAQNPEPVSIVDDPELQAAVSRAEATLAASEPNYVGLQDADLDAEYDAMRERQEAGRKLHFSIFGKVGE